MSRRPTPPGTLLAVAALGGTALLGTACGANFDIDVSHGETVTRTFEVTDFDEVVVDGPFDVRVEVGREPSVTVDVNQEIEDRVEVEQDGDRLTIGLSGGLISTSGQLDVTITMPELTRLELDGAVDAEVVDLDSNRLELTLDGASNVTGRGSVGVLVIDIDGASGIDFGRVGIDTAEVDADGASDVDITDADAVTGRAGGASSIDVSDEADVEVETSGAASVD